MSDDWERIRKEAAVFCPKYYPGFFINGLRETTRNLSQDIP
jgi:hypothetical protein